MPFKAEICIDARRIGPDQPTFVVAEMSANHGQDLIKAKELVHAAHESGADAIKLQTYRADTLTMKCEQPHFYISDGAWKGQYLYDLYKGAFMPWEFHADLFELAATLGICCFSSPFDDEAVDLLEQLNAPAYKIASAELIDHPLLTRVARTGKPIILSTGNATLQEIDEAVRLLRGRGVSELALLKCTSAYPAPAESINLRTISHLAEAFGCPVGFSDHTIGNAVPIASVAMGACIIEKHFMLSRDEKTTDSFFSTTPDEMRGLVHSIREVEKALGDICYPEQEAPWRRCLYAARDIRQGEVFSRQNVANLRPGGGELKPRHLGVVLGRVAATEIRRGEQLKWAQVGQEK